MRALHLSGRFGDGNCRSPSWCYGDTTSNVDGLAEASWIYRVGIQAEYSTSHILYIHAPSMISLQYHF
jgi:hypothetical protein